jgi:CRP/FNR family transcriptional regulator
MFAANITVDPVALETPAPTVDRGRGYLYGHTLLPTLPAEHWSRLRRTAKPRRIAQGDPLFLCGTSPDSCFLVRDGFVKVGVASHRGEERILAILGAGATIGDVALLDGQPRQVGAQALTDCQVLQIDRASMMAWIRDDPAASQQLAKALSIQLRRLSDEAIATCFLSVKGRVAHALLQLATHVGVTLPDRRVELRYAIRQGELAAMASVTRESVNRFLTQWRREGLLTVADDGRLRLDEGGLEAMVAAED